MEMKKKRDEKVKGEAPTTFPKVINNDSDKIMEDDAKRRNT